MDGTVEERLQKTFFLVEATSFEYHILWLTWASASSAKTATSKLDWELLTGVRVKVGSLAGKNIFISMFWCSIEDRLVGFWRPMSAVVDYTQISAWTVKRFSARWSNDQRPSVTDANNFHRCVQAIREANKEY